MITLVINKNDRISKRWRRSTRTSQNIVIMMVMMIGEASKSELNSISSPGKLRMICVKFC